MGLHSSASYIFGMLANLRMMRFSGRGGGGVRNNGASFSQTHMTV